MKYLCLLRHAKSSWADRELSDIERPLKARGLRDCELVGKVLAKTPGPVEFIFCSPAKRAQMTVEAVLNATGFEGIPWQVDERLYTFDVRQLLRWVHSLNDTVNGLLIVGHNPAFTRICNELADEELENVPTCGYAELRCDVDSWQDVEAGCAELTSFITPKMLRRQKKPSHKEWFR